MNRGRVRALVPALVVGASLVCLQLAPGGCGGKGDGVIDGEVTVEAQLRGEWILFSFAEQDVLRDGDGDPLAVDDPAGTEGWDLAFSQWVIASNSGTSGSPGSVSRGGLLAVEGQVGDWPVLADYDARCVDFVAADATDNAGGFGCDGGMPTVDDGYISDLLDDPDGAGPFGEISYNPSLSFWFEYDFSGHEAYPYGNIYVLELHDGGCVKLQVTDYYDEAGESGFTSFSWGYLPD